MSWHNAPVLVKLTACQQGGNRGAQLWGVDLKGTLYTTYQKTPGGVWSDWMSSGWAEKNYPKQVYELAAAQRAVNAVPASPIGRLDRVPGNLDVVAAAGIEFGIHVRHGGRLPVFPDRNAVVSVVREAQ